MGDYLPAIWLVEITGSPSYAPSISPTPINHSASLPNSVLIPVIVGSVCGAFLLAALGLLIYRRQKTRGESWATSRLPHAPQIPTAGVAGMVLETRAPTAEFGSPLAVSNPMYAKVDV